MTVTDELPAAGTRDAEPSSGPLPLPPEDGARGVVVDVATGRRSDVLRAGYTPRAAPLAGSRPRSRPRPTPARPGEP
ncbi:hypothetical protein ACI78V_20690 [Geodermatophilus sp. SYSU D00742]